MPTEPLRRISEVDEQGGLAAFVDVETTGLSTRYDEVVELAIALFAFDRSTGEIRGILDEYAGLRDPGRPIPAGAAGVHGIRDCDVKGKRLDDEQVLRLMDRAEFLVAHNESFDRPFVERLYPEAAGKTWLCSMNGVPWRREGFASRGLQSLLSDHGIRPERAHRGAPDVRAALQLLACTDEDGVCYFKYLLDRHAHRASSSRAARKTRAATKTQTAGATSRIRAAGATRKTGSAGSARQAKAAGATKPWMLRLLERCVPQLFRR
jgi:DNA polymerase-3 subunit epsilon